MRRAGPPATSTYRHRVLRTPLRFSNGSRLSPPAATAVLAGVLVVLLAPHHMDLPITWLSSSGLLGAAAAGGTPLWWALEDVANIALFVPVGVVLGRRLGPVPGLLAAGALSAAAESAQQFIPSRHASVLDVTMNVLGAALGVALAVLSRRRGSGQPHLPAVPAGPVRDAVLGLDVGHPLEAGGAVRHLEPALVGRAVHGRTGDGRAGSLVVSGAGHVGHPTMVRPRTDGRGAELVR